MSAQIIPISDRGQITIPIKFRKQLKHKYIACKIDKNKRIILEPLLTSEELLSELKNVSLPLKEQKPKYNLCDLKKAIFHSKNKKIINLSEQIDEIVYQ